MPLSEYQYLIDNYTFRDLGLLLEQHEEEQREFTELMELSVMYGYASVKSRSGKLIKIFEKPKETLELNEAQIGELKQDKEYLKNTFSNTL